MSYVEIPRNAARLTVELPRPVGGKAFDISNLTLRIAREGKRIPLAEYPCIYAESGKADFLLDDTFVGAKSGFYIGTYYLCKKPVGNVKLKIPRDRLGNATVKTQIPSDDCVGKSVCKTCEEDCKCL